MKKILLILFMVFLLALSGCNDKGGEKTTKASSQFVGGKEGLQIDFVGGTPPAEVLDQDQTFGASIKLTNVGEYDVPATKAKVTLSGFASGDFGVSEGALVQEIQEEMMGASRDATGSQINGAILTLDFPADGSAFAHQKAIAGSVTYNIKADVCYEYASYANSKLCILKDILGSKGKTDNLCEINGIKPVDSSGAPVQITNFRESVASSNKISFVFTVEHNAKGSVYEKGTDCEEDFNKRNKVVVNVDTGISGTLSCSGLQGAGTSSPIKGTATLLNNKREIRCTQTIDNPSDYEKLIELSLEYDYRNTVSTKVTVKHLGD